MADEGSGAQGAEELESGSFVGFDGDPVELGGPPPAAGKEPAPARQAAPAPPEEEEQHQEAVVDRAFIESKRRPGESWEDAATRLYSNSLAARRRIDGERREYRQSMERLAEEQELQRVRLEPFLREYYKARQDELTRQQMAAIPDRETDPQGYAIWLAEEQLRRQTERDRQEAEAAAEEQRLSAVAAADEVWAVELQQSLQIPEFDADFRLVAEFNRDVIRHEFPTAKEEQVEELLLLQNTLAMRNALATGRSIQEYVWERAAMLRRAAGQAQQPAQAPQRPAAKTNGSPSPTAQRLAAAATRAQKAGAMAGPAGPGGAGGLPGQGDSGLDLPEEDFIKWALGSKADVNKLSKKRFASLDD